MYNATYKQLKNAFGALIIGSFLLCSCAKEDNKEAQALLEKAQSELEAGNYEQAKILTDSIKNSYPKEIDIRKEALHIASRANEGLAILQLQQADSLTAALGARGDSLIRLLKFVKNPIEGYYVASSADPSSFIGTDGLQARVSPGGDFYLVSSLGSRAVKSTSISVSDGVNTALTPSISYDGERNDRSMGAEVITFMGLEADSVGKFILKNKGKPLTLSFNGSSSYSMKLPEKQVKEIALLYDYVTTVRRFKLANIEKERLSKMVDITRSQAARTFVEKDSTKQQ